MITKWCTLLYLAISKYPSTWASNMADVQWHHGSCFFSFLDWFPVLGVGGGVCVAPPPVADDSAKVMRDSHCLSPTLFCWWPAGCLSSFLAWLSRWGLWGGLWEPLPAKDGCFLSFPGLVPGLLFSERFSAAELGGGLCVVGWPPPIGSLEKELCNSNFPRSSPLWEYPVCCWLPVLDKVPVLGLWRGILAARGSLLVDPFPKTWHDACFLSSPPLCWCSVGRSIPFKGPGGALLFDGLVLVRVGKSERPPTVTGFGRLGVFQMEKAFLSCRCFCRFFKLIISPDVEGLDPCAVCCNGLHRTFESIKRVLECKILHIPDISCQWRWSGWWDREYCIQFIIGFIIFEKTWILDTQEAIYLLHVAVIKALANQYNNIKEANLLKYFDHLELNTPKLCIGKIPVDICEHFSWNTRHDNKVHPAIRIW